MGFNLEKLNEISKAPSTECLEREQFLDDNWMWIEKSTRIALMTSESIRQNGITQKEFAEKMGVTPQYISKLLKGRENLSLETICKIERILNIQLIEVMNIFNQTEVISSSGSIKGIFTEQQTSEKVNVENNYTSYLNVA